MIAGIENVLLSFGKKNGSGIVILRKSVADSSKISDNLLNGSNDRRLWKASIHSR